MTYHSWGLIVRHWDHAPLQEEMFDELVTFSQLKPHADGHVAMEAICRMLVASSDQILPFVRFLRFHTQRNI
jgi:hypothetical protein